MTDERDESRDAEAPTAPAAVSAASAKDAPPRSSSRTPTQALYAEVRDGKLDKPMGLSDFMFQLGFAYKLPGKSTPTVQQEAVAAARKRRTRVLLPVLAVVSLIVALGAWALQPRPSREVPTTILGRWTTMDPKYAGRAFTITSEGVTLDFGAEASPAAFPLVAVIRDSLVDSALVELRYNQGRGLTTFRFAYVEAPRPTIYLPNPPGVPWIRKSDVGYEGAEPAVMRDRSRGPDPGTVPR